MSPGDMYICVACLHASWYFPDNTCIVSPRRSIWGSLDESRHLLELLYYIRIYHRLNTFDIGMINNFVTKERLIPLEDSDICINKYATAAAGIMSYGIMCM